MKCNSIIIFHLFFNCFIVIFGATLIENQIEIKRTNYSLIFDSNPSKCNIITLGNISVIDKLTGGVIKNINFDSTIPPLTILKVNSSDHYLIAGNDFYKIELNQNKEIESIVKRKTITLKFQMKDLFAHGKDSFGFFPEKVYPLSVIPRKGVKVNMNSSEIVLYDTLPDKFYFYFFEEDEYYEVNNHNFNNIENHISCVFIDSAEYACVFRQNDIIQLGTFIFQYKNESGYKEIICNNIFNISSDPNHDFAVIKDISDNFGKKILCIREKNTYLIKCNFCEITILKQENEFAEPSMHYYSLISNTELNRYYESLSFNMDNCYFTGFYQEYLFCCGEKNKITCRRFTKEFNLIYNFSIQMQGNNKDLIILNNNDYASLFYINEKEEEEAKLYEYFIYPPKCENTSVDLNVSQNFQKKINEFFRGKENIKYFLKFENLPSEFGSIKLGRDDINENNIYEIELQNNEKLFYFSPLNNLLIGKEISIIYNISLDTYWSICEIKLIYDSCYNSCENCSLGVKYSTEENHYCLDCKQNYYPFAQKENNCYSKEEGKNQNWYFNEHLEKFDLCNSSCSTCSGPSENDCLSCSSEENYLYNKTCLSICPEQTFPFKNENNQKICLNCYENCKTCNGSGNSTEMFCTSCFNSYLKEGNNCYKKKINEISSTEFKDQILNDITSHVNSSKVFNGSNFLAVVLSSDEMDPKEQLKKGISAIDLGNCTNVLKEYYNIPKNESLIILNMEIKEGENNNNDNNCFNLGKNTQIEIYDYSGNKLNLSLCKEDIVVMKYIGDVTELNIESAKDLASQGIDVFNAEDDFFNDICHPFDNPDGVDIILKDRRNDIYQNATFCQDGCTYSGVDYDVMAANCICDSSSFQGNEENITNSEKDNSESVSFNSLADSFISNLISFNFDVIKCYNLIFNKKILLRNIGFYCLASMFFLQIICLFVFLIKRLKPLKRFMLIFNNKNIINKNTKKNKNIKNKKINKNIKATPPKKKIKLIFSPLDGDKEQSNINKKIKFKKEINNNNIFSNSVLNIDNSSRKRIIPENDYNVKNILKKGLQNNILHKTINIQTPILNINNFIKGNNLKKNNKIKKWNSKIINNNIITNNQKPIKKCAFNKNNYNIETILDGKNRGKKFKNLNFDIKILSLTDGDLLDMEFEEAIIKDKRSYLRIYWGFLVDSQIILGTFFTKNYLNLFVIKLSFFICTFQLSFFLNSLFYTDEYISDAYHNDGVLDFISGLPKTIYSFIATLITTNLLRMLSNSQGELMGVIRQRALYKNYIEIINRKLSKLRIKLVIYFIFVFIMSLSFLYYVTTFCAVYRNSQKYWFIGCIESFGLDTLVAIIVCIFVSLLRYISLRNRIKCFYVLANIINNFL